MARINISDALMARLQRRHLNDQELLLITDDGGGKYSLQGGACSIGTRFTLVSLAQPDSDYPIKVENNQGLHLWTSQYDLMFLNDGVSMDYQQGRIAIKDNAHMLDRAVQITDGAEVLAAFKQGVTAASTGC